MKQKIHHSGLVSESILIAGKITDREPASNYQGVINQRGFTIVETLFVLAIGALILIMTFLALGQTQRSKRDSQRKTDFAKINQNIASWTNEHHGILPNGNSEVQTAASPLPGSPDVSGDPYNVTAVPITTTCSAGALNNVYYERINDRAYKIKICLESGEFIENH